MSASPDLMMLESAARQASQANALPRRFVAVALEMLRNTERSNVVEALSRRLDPWDVKAFEKAAVTANTFAEVWATGAPAEMANAWVESIAATSILDTLRGQAQVLPDIGNAIVATGAVANVVEEGAPKAVTRLTMAATDEADRIKSVAMVVMTKELANAPGGHAMRVFENALRSAVTQASNEALLSALPKLPSSYLGGAWAALQEAVSLAGPSQSYVVAATPSVVAELAFASDGRMGVNGGQPIPGIYVVPHDYGASDTKMTVIPASRVALIDWGLQVRSAGHASVQMDTEPHSPPTASTVLVSLWQHGLVALLAERSFRVVSTDPAIEVT